MKTCTDCGVVIDKTNEVRSGRGVKSRCRTCHNIWRRETRDPQVTRNQQYKTRYGITLDDYDSMYAEQGGVCAICGTDSPGSRFNHFHVDHDHDTGKVRQLLCEACNTGLGKFRDNPLLLRLAASYLEKHDRSINSTKELSAAVLG